MERSDELVQLTHAIYDAMANGDVAGFEAATLDDVLVIGTDPQEWWTGRDTAAAAFRGQTEAMGGGFPVRAGDPVAYAHGDVGWVADRPTMTMPDGSSLEFRLTFVTVRTGGDWKLAQMHFSAGVSNEEAFGQTLPT
jgi:ketosteroid isomerase-like protein